LFGQYSASEEIYSLRISGSTQIKRRKSSATLRS
jgi:hypothetical protein